MQGGYYPILSARIRIRLSPSMSHDQRGLLPFWSFPIGSCRGVRLRVSCLLPLAALVLSTWYGWRMGLSLTAVLVAAVLVHELGRVIAAGLCMAEISTLVFWPGGGLQPARVARRPPPLLLAFGGLAANALFCLALAWPLWSQGRLSAALDPESLNQFRLSSDVWGNLLFLSFSVSWILVLINLLPIVPCDAGLFLEGLLMRALGEKGGLLAARRAGWVFSTVLFLFGLMTEQVVVTAVAGIAMVALLVRYVPVEEFETEDDRFLGYDFSEGYTSLARSTPEDEPPPPPTFLDRWRQRREELRRRRQEELDRLVSHELDRVLAKVHESGLDSLDATERKLLQQASLRYRERGPSV